MSNFLKNSPGVKKEVMFLNPEDNRYMTLQVERETENIVYCKKHEGVQYRFFKHGPGWSGGKNTRFLAVEGAPLISYISGKDKNGVDLWKSTDTKSFIEMALGENHYKKLESAIRQKLEEHCIGSTVLIKPYIPDESTRPIFDKVKAASVLRDADINNLADLGTATVVKKNFDKIMDKIPWILAGFGLTYVLQGLGVLK